jgi:hypothetical protein
VQREWKDRVLEALEIALRVAEGRSRGTWKTVKSIGPEEGSHLWDEGEKEALGTLILARVLLQMEPSLRGHPNYREACRILEELPLWSLDKETALQVIDTLSSILGLPFRYAPKPFRSAPIAEAGAACSDVGIDGHPRPFQKPIAEAGAARNERMNEDRETRLDNVNGGHPRPPGASDRTGIGADVGRVVDAKIEHSKKLLGFEGFVK